jgi:hypothetical protein
VESLTETTQQDFSSKMPLQNWTVAFATMHIPTKQKCVQNQEFFLSKQIFDGPESALMR